MDPHPTSSSNEPKLRDHVYDGIQEYDQKLPNWWLFTLYITIVWFIGHWLCYYQLGIGSSDQDEMDKVIAEQKAARDKQTENITDEQLWAMSRDPQAVEAGKAVVMTPGTVSYTHSTVPHESEGYIQDGDAIITIKKTQEDEAVQSVE